MKDVGFIEIFINIVFVSVILGFMVSDLLKIPLIKGFQITALLINTVILYHWIQKAVGR